MKFCLLGSGISYSLSPLIYDYWFKMYGIKAEYILEDIFSNALDMNFVIYLKNNYQGFNITKPFKENIIPFLDSFSKEAELIGSVNLVRSINNKLVGYNTDYLGLLASFNFYNLNLSNKKILILGSGGAVRSLLFALQNKGNKFYLLNRTKENAFKIKSIFANENIVVEDDFSKLSTLNYDIIFNGTILNLEDSLLFFKINVRKNDTIYDMNYSYNYSNNLKKSNLIDGLLMLLYQASYNFDILFNIKPIVNEDLIKKIKEK